MSKVITLLILAAILVSQDILASSFESLTIENEKGEVMWIQGPENTETQIDLGVGPTIDGQYFKITPLKDEKKKIQFRILVQHETSISMGLAHADGPHYDLLDWKHGRSEWNEAKLISESKFKLPNFHQARMDTPFVTREEVVANVIKMLKKTGNSDQSLSDKDLGSHGWGLSSIRMKILQKMDSKWTEIKTLEFLIPMGC